MASLIADAEDDGTVGKVVLPLKRVGLGSAIAGILVFVGLQLRLRADLPSAMIGMDWLWGQIVWSVLTAVGLISLSGLVNSVTARRLHWAALFSLLLHLCVCLGLHLVRLPGTPGPHAETTSPADQVDQQSVIADYGNLPVRPTVPPWQQQTEIAAEATSQAEVSRAAAAAPQQQSTPSPRQASAAAVKPASTLPETAVTSLAEAVAMPAAAAAAARTRPTPVVQSDAAISFTAERPPAAQSPEPHEPEVARTLSAELPDDRRDLSSAAAAASTASVETSVRTDNVAALTTAPVQLEPAALPHAAAAGSNRARTPPPQPVAAVAESSVAPMRSATSVDEPALLERQAAPLVRQTAVEFPNADQAARVSAKSTSSVSAADLQPSTSLNDQPSLTATAPAATMSAVSQRQHRQNSSAPGPVRAATEVVVRPAPAAASDVAAAMIVSRSLHASRTTERLPNNRTRRSTSTAPSTVSALQPVDGASSNNSVTGSAARPSLHGLSSVRPARRGGPATRTIAAAGTLGVDTNAAAVSGNSGGVGRATAESAAPPATSVEALIARPAADGRRLRGASELPGSGQSIASMTGGTSGGQRTGSAIGVSGLFHSNPGAGRNSETALSASLRGDRSISSQHDVGMNRGGQRQGTAIGRALRSASAGVGRLAVAGPQEGTAQRGNDGRSAIAGSGPSNKTGEGTATGATVGTGARTVGGTPSGGGGSGSSDSGGLKPGADPFGSLLNASHPGTSLPRRSGGRLPGRSGVGRSGESFSPNRSGQLRRSQSGVTRQIAAANPAPPSPQSTSPERPTLEQFRSESVPSAARAAPELRSRQRQPINIAFSSRTPDARRKAVQQLGGSEESEQAVERGLRWLAQHQYAAGNWSIHESFCSHSECSGVGTYNADSAATGLALLAFLGAGETHREGRYQQEVQRALTWLVQQQRSDGSLFGPTSQFAQLYSHGIAAIALCEAYGMTRDAQLRQPAQQAVNYIVAVQHPQLGGWRYQPQTESDTSVSGWQLMALRSGQMAGLQIPQSAMDGVGGWLDTVESTSAEGRFRYHPTKPVTEAMTAEGLLMRQYLGVPAADHSLQSGAAWLGQRPPRRDAPNVYYWYYATQVMFHLQGDAWQQWNQTLRPLLVDTQQTQGPAAGSWNPTAPAKDAWSQSGGRHYVTCLNLLMLEVYYRHLPLYVDLQPGTTSTSAR